MRRASRPFLLRSAKVVRAFGRRLSVKVAAGIIGVAALVLASAGGLSLWIFLGVQMRTVTELHQLQASTAAERIQRFADGIEWRLGELVAAPWLTSSDEDRRIDALRTLRALPPVSTLRLIDPEGREQLRVARLGPDITASGADFSQNRDYLAARQSGSRVSAVYFQDGSEPYATFYLRGSSPRHGGLAADVNLKLIWDIVAATRIGKAGRMLLVDGDGDLISHPDISQVLRRADLSKLPHVQAGLNLARPGSEAALIMGRDLNGEPVLSAHARLPALGWSVITELPRAEVLGPIHSIVRLSSIALLGGLAVALLCGVALARSMIRPIEELTAGAAKIGAGALDHRIAIAGSDEFAQLGEQFNEMARHLQAERDTLEQKVAQRTQELARANQAKSRFLASASHDLRQPLHAVSLFVDELRSSPSRQRRAQLKEKLAEAVASLNGMFDEILDTSKIEADAIKPTLSRFQMGPLLHELRAVFAPAASAKRLELQICCCDVWIESDRLLLSRMLQNLLANAVRYTEAGRVALSCQSSADTLVISVWDTGPGISPEMKPEIFGEFFRAPTPGQSGERGLGLGLFIVASFARLLDHPICLESTLGRGSTFSVRVPVVPAAPAAQASEDLQRHIHFGQGHRAAVTGCDPTERKATAKLLLSWGFDVDEAVSPDDLARDDIDLLVADCDRAAADGATAALLAMQEARPSLRIVILTPNPESMKRDHAGPCFDVLRRPAPPILLRTAVARMVSRLRPS